MTYAANVYVFFVFKKSAKVTLTSLTIIFDWGFVYARLTKQRQCRSVFLCTRLDSLLFFYNYFILLFFLFLMLREELGIHLFLHALAFEDGGHFLSLLGFRLNWAGLGRSENSCSSLLFGDSKSITVALEMDERPKQHLTVSGSSTCCFIMAKAFPLCCGRELF